MGSWVINLHDHIPGEQLKHVNLKIQSKATTLHITDISVNDSVSENHAKIWSFQILNKAIISLVDNEYIFHLLLTRLFSRSTWQQDSWFHMLAWVLISLHKQDKQLQDKPKTGEKGKKSKLLYQQIIPIQELLVHL